MKYCLLYTLAILLLGSCSKSDILPDNDNKGEQVRFAASVQVKEDDWRSHATRGMITDNSNINNFGVFSFHTGGKQWSEVSAFAVPNKMYNVVVTRTPSTNEWVYNPPVEWLGGDGSLFSFFGYSPRATGAYSEPNQAQGNNIEVISSATDAGIPSLSYTTLDYVPMQIDLLVAKPVYDTRPVERVRMQFSHALSQIRFKAWAQQSFVRVKSIEITNIKYKATISLDGTSVAGVEVKTFLLDNMSRTVSTDKQNMTDLSDSGNAFMLVPQDLASNTSAQITVTYEVGAETKTSRPYTIKENWQPNQSYTYILALGGTPTDEMLVTSVEMTDWIVDSEEEDMETSPVTFRTRSPKASQIVEIEGLKWTTGNLIAVRSMMCKVGAPDDYGLYFHYGSLVGWSGGANGDGTGQGTPLLEQKVKPVGYTGSPTWPAGYVSVRGIPTYSCRLEAIANITAHSLAYNQVVLSGALRTTKA